VWSKSLSLCIALLVSLAGPDLRAQQVLDGQNSVGSNLEHLPLIFEPNTGQVPDDVRFVSRGNAYTVFLRPDRTVLMLLPAADHGTQSQASVVTLELLGTNKEASSKGSDQLPGKSNYFIGKDFAKWIADIPQYGKVGFKSIYAGIDLVYYGNNGQLEYDFLLSPGANPRALRFRVEGAKKVVLDGSGGLSLQVDGGVIELQRPTIYQETKGIRRVIAGQFALRGNNEVGLKLGDYDHRKSLIVDPVLSYSTLIGANNGGPQVQGIAVDPTGNVYIVGTTQATNYPVLNAVQSANNGNSDVFITKLNPAGDKILYSTYLGGSASDTARAIAVDSSGSAYVTGYTSSGDFPTTPGAYMTPCVSCNSPFVTKILTDGSLGYSTVTGGSNIAALAIALDSSGAAYLAGDANSADLPLVNAFQSTPAGAFVQKLNPQGSGLEYSTYLGGGGDLGLGVAVDSSGSAYVVGGTTALNFPLQKPIQASQLSFPLTTGFITKFSPNGASLVFSTYLGGSQVFSYGDYVTGVAIDPQGNVHVSGTTGACDFPFTLNVFSTDCVTWASDPMIFVMSLNSSGSQILFSTALQPGSFFGGGYSPEIAVDKNGNSYVTGVTASNTYPMLNPIESTSQLVSQDSSFSSPNSFVTELDPSGNLLFSTYLGQTGGVSQAAGIAVDSKGGIYVAGAGGGDFPLLHPIPTELKQSSANENATLFVAKISSKSTPQFSLSPRVSPTLTLRNVSSVPLTISGITTSSNFTQQTNCGSVLAPGTGCTLLVIGADDKKTTGTVTITSNAYSTPQKFIISKSPTGDTLEPNLTVFPAFLEFPSQLIGTSGAPLQVVVQNLGSPSAISSIAMNQNSPFTETNDCPSTLGTLSSCTITVNYTAATLQDFGGLGITAGPYQQETSIGFEGSGSSTAIAASTPSIEFGNQFVGTAPLGRIVNFTNTTPYPTSLTGISVSAGYMQTNTCTGVLAPQSACRVSVSFLPTATQDVPGTLTVANDSLGGPQVINLHATGITPGALALTPIFLNVTGFLGNPTPAGTPITATNNSQTMINVQSVTVTGPFTETNSCGSLAPAATCQIVVTFTPTQTGVGTGTLQVAFAGPGSPQTISLTGTAQTYLQWSPVPVQFGLQPVKVKGPVTGAGLDNYGNPVTIDSFKIVGSEFAIVEKSCKSTLARDYGCGLELTFTPSAMGLRTGTLTVLTGSDKEPLTVPLQGTGISSGLGTLSVASLDFATQPVGTTSAPQTITFENTGTGALTPGSIVASTQFTETNTCTAPLDVGASCNISISFAPTLEGILEGTLTVQDNGVGSPHTIALSGLSQQ
jgi:hypothetical protein